MEAQVAQAQHLYKRMLGEGKILKNSETRSRHWQELLQDT